MKQTYHVGSYLIWGHQKTREELLEEKLEKQIEREKELMDRLEGLHHEISEVKELEMRFELKNHGNNDSNVKDATEQTVHRRRSL